jgi:hypothetical protein
MLKDAVIALLIFIPMVVMGGAFLPVSPYPAAPLCESHDTSTFHTLWNEVDGCHYDHEHGSDPFTEEVAAAFPGFDLFALLGGVGVGHTNPSSPMENTHKHGGFKWDVTLSHSAECTGGLGAPTGVNALVVQYHAFGDYSIEMESRVHSAAGMIRQCRTSNPTDYGYAFFNQFQDYGQRVRPYQGAVMQYPDTPIPAYNPGISPYFSVDCVGPVVQCRPSREFVLTRNANGASTWVSRPQAAPIGSTLFAILFRVRDNYQLSRWEDSEYPFTFDWVCSSDGGATFDPNIGANGGKCRWNNSTTRIHELHGEIPAAWDNLPMDTDRRIGRITAEGYVTAFGSLNSACVEPGPDCHPFKLVNAFTGRYTSAFALISGKGSFSPENLPERDIYFCNGVVCPEPGFGVGSSGWIGPNN